MKDMEVLEALRRKNSCLKEFLRLTLEFTRLASVGDLSTLKIFESHREAVLRTVRLYDGKIEELSASLQARPLSNELKTLLRSEIKTGEKIVAEIIQADQALLPLIESEGRRLLSEISGARKGKSIISKFKSHPSHGEAGKGLDEHL